MMKTEIITNTMDRAAEILKSGGLVAVPTETVYGLAGNGLNENAVKNIYEVKGRPAVKPLSLMVPDSGAMDKYCKNVPQQAKFLAERFWPGPLTIVLESREIVPEIVRAGGRTVGLRCPDHPLTLELLECVGIPLAAPSANPSGEPSPKDAEKVRDYFDGKIEGIIDGGVCGIGKESTIIDMSAAPYRILRLGALSEDEIADALAENMTVVGVTGGTGSGKTSALRLLEERGALVLDCDEVYHGLLTTNAAMLDELKESFPAAFAGGAFDRKALGRLVFQNAELLEKLNEITHKYVKCELGRLLRDHAMRGGTLAAIDAIELFSSGADKLCDVTLAVVADVEKRVERIMRRDGISRAYALSRIRAQKSDEYFRERCTRTIENNGTEAELRLACNKIFNEVL